MILWVSKWNDPPHCLEASEVATGARRKPKKKGGFAAAAGGWGWREGKGDLVVF